MPSSSRVLQNASRPEAPTSRQGSWRGVFWPRSLHLQLGVLLTLLVLLGGLTGLLGGWKKNVAKVLSREGSSEAQAVLTTAPVLSEDPEASDVLEPIDDDDSLVGEPSLAAMSAVLGLALLLLAPSGLRLWWGPKLVLRSTSPPS